MLKHLGNYFLGSFLYVILVIVVTDAVRLIGKYAFHVNFIENQTVFVITGAIGVTLILGISLYGILHAKKIKTTKYQVTIKKECGEAVSDELKVVLLADTHFGYSVETKQAEKIVKKINEQNADLVCFAGDIFDNDYDTIAKPDKLKEILSRIESKYGTYACWGNHDINEPILAGFTFNGNKEEYDDPRMHQFLEDAGIRMLDDEAECIAESFYLIGRRDPGRIQKIGGSRKTPKELTEGLDHKKPIIVMDHQPKEFKKLLKAGVDLDLCGHTHDGQVFPGNILLKITWKNPCGYRKFEGKNSRELHNIVTSGAGIWGPNMRVGTNNEICVIDVKFKG